MIGFPQFIYRRKLNRGCREQQLCRRLYDFITHAVTFSREYQVLDYLPISFYSRIIERGREEGSRNSKHGSDNG